MSAPNSRNISTGGIATASHEHYNKNVKSWDERAYRALDGSYATKWHSGCGATNAFDPSYATKWHTGCGATNDVWLAVKFVSGPCVVTWYEIIHNENYNGRDPRDWELQGSNDGQTWVKLHCVNGYVFKGTNTASENYVNPSLQVFDQVRVFITANSRGNLCESGVEILCLNVWGYPAAAVVKTIEAGLPTLSPKLHAWVPPTIVQYPAFSRNTNPAAMDMILTIDPASLTADHWAAISRSSRPEAIARLKANPSHINWSELSKNTSQDAAEMLRVFDVQIDWRALSANSSDAALELLAANVDKICMDELAANYGIFQE